MEAVWVPDAANLSYICKALTRTLFMWATPWEGGLPRVAWVQKWTNCSVNVGGAGATGAALKPDDEVGAGALKPVGLGALNPSM